MQWFFFKKIYERIRPFEVNLRSFDQNISWMTTIPKFQVQIKSVVQYSVGDPNPFHVEYWPDILKKNFW